MRCYKLTTKEGNSLFVKGKYRLHYETGKRIEPKIGKIFVVKSLEQARNIAFENYNNCRIYECECDNFQKVYCYAVLYYPDKRETNRRIKKFWNGEKMECIKADSDIYLCDSLKVIKEV